MADTIKENEEGILEVYNEKGEKVGTQSFRKNHRTKNRKTRTVTKKVTERLHVLTPKLRKTICELALEGETITSIARKIGKTRLVLYRWFANHPDFRKEFEGFKKVRALHYEEEMLKIIEKTEKKSQVPVSKFKFDSYKTLGEINNPERFSKKTTIEGSEDKPIKIVFQTGIDRSEKKELKDVKSELLAIEAEESEEKSS